jgi:hypothetical protein
MVKTITEMEEEMKTYVLRDTVKAVPMTYNTAAPLFNTERKQDDEEGYLVEYNNGKQTWVSKEDFEKNAIIYDDLLDKIKYSINNVFEELRLLNCAKWNLSSSHNTVEPIANIAAQYLINYQNYLELIVDSLQPFKLEAFTLDFFEAMFFVKMGYMVTRFTCSEQTIIYKGNLKLGDTTRVDFKEIIKVSCGGQKREAYYPTSDDLVANDWTLYEYLKDPDRRQLLAKHFMDVVKH